MNHRAPFFILVATLLICLSPFTKAGVKSEVLEVGSEYVLRKFGVEVTKELGEEGAQVLARKMEVMAVKYGEKETVDAVGKVGPRLFRLVEEVGEGGAAKAVKLMGRVGEDSIWIVSRKKSMAPAP